MISIYATSPSGDKLYVLDDPSSSTDFGESFVARLLTNAFEGAVAGYNHLRRMTQAVSITNSATVTLTPLADNAEDATQGETFVLSAAVDGQRPVLDARPDVSGTIFQIQVEVTEHDGLTQLGEFDAFFQTRRTARV